MQNLEQLEAFQMEKNKERQRLYEALNDEDKKKEDALNKAIEILNNQKVPFIMFAQVPEGMKVFKKSYLKKVGFTLFHNFSNITNVYDVGFTEENKKIANELLLGSHHSIFCFLEESYNLGLGNDNKPWWEKINVLFQYIFDNIKLEEQKYDEDKII